MEDDSSRAHKVKERVRQGKINRDEFAKVMRELRRTGKNIVELPSSNVSESARNALMTAGLTMPAGSSTFTALEDWDGRDITFAGGKGVDTGRDSDMVAMAQGLLRRRGMRGRKVRADHIGGGVRGSPLRESGGEGRSRRSSGRIFESPRMLPGSITDPRGSGGLGRQPWSAPGRPFRKSGSGPPSSERPGPSPSGTPLPGEGEAVLGAGDGVWDPRQPGVGVNHGGAGLGGRGVSAPPSTSEMDNLSSFSNTSTVLTDLSTRLEKIEGMLTRLLAENEISSRPSGTGGAAAGAAGGDGIWKSTQKGSESNREMEGEGSRTEESTDGVSNVVRDTAQELREVRGRLRLLEEEESRRASASSADVVIPADPAGPRPASALLAQSKGKSAANPERNPCDGGGMISLQGVVPASELPEDDEIGKPQGIRKIALPEVLPTTTSMQSTDQGTEEAEISTGAMASVAAAAAPESAETHASETKYGRAQEELKDEDSDGGWSERRRLGKLSTISESPTTS